MDTDVFKVIHKAHVKVRTELPLYCKVQNPYDISHLQLELHRNFQFGIQH